MSQENMEIVRAQYDSFNRLAEAGDVHSHVPEFFDPDCEYWPEEEIDAIRGHEALIGWLERWFAAWSSFHAEIEEIIDGGEQLVVAEDTTGRGRRSGVEIRKRWYMVYEIREGRILRWREYPDRDSALEAAGLSQ